MEEYKSRPSGAVSGLNEYHLRKISVFLCEIEKSLNLVEIYIKNNLSGRMYIIENNLTPEEKEDLLESIAMLKKCICEFAEELKLKPITEGLHEIIRGYYTINWADLYEIAPEKLNSYGEIGMEAIEPLNYFINKLKNLFEISKKL